MRVPDSPTFTDKIRDRERWLRFADWIAVGLAASLPWSTSATGIFAGMLAAVLIPAISKGEWRTGLSQPAAWLAVALCALGAIGMAWAKLPLTESWKGLESFLKLLFIPLLMIQFRRSEFGRYAFFGFLLSCTLLMVISWALFYFPGIPWRRQYAIGIPVKDFISQSTIFTICVFLLAELALIRWQEGRKRFAVLLIVLALAFAANLVIVTFTRATVFVVPILILLFGLTRLGWRSTAGLIAGSLVLAALAWPFAPQLQVRVSSFTTEIQEYRADNARSSAAERLEFWRKSLGFVREAPWIGHGTGSIPELFRQTAIGQTGVSAVASSNPHNQTLAVAIQLGIVGVALLFAMWAAHLLIFRGSGLASWAGLVVVVQNIVSSLFNSHLFDFTHGWVYVVGVGIAAGAVLRERATFEH
jgi:O-antigen ligase